MDFDSKLINKYEKLYTILAKTIIGYDSDAFRIARDEYSTLRTDIVSNSELRSKMPAFIQECHTLDDFSVFIKSKGYSSKERRIYLKREFKQADAFVYNISANPGDEVISETLSHRAHLFEIWEKALKRRATDPDGAITLARTLLETTFKYILDEKGLRTSYDKSTKLSELCYKASTAIAIHPKSTEDEELTKLFGAYIKVVVALGELRNAHGDAHGRSESDIKPENRIAELAVNLAGSIALFFLLTLEESSI